MERTRRSCAAAMLVTAGAVAAGPAGAQLATRFGGDVSVREGFATNPFLGVEGDSGSGYVEISAAPTLVITEPVATTSLFANYRRTQYYQRYSSTDGYGFTAAHSRQLSSRTSANVSVQYDSSIIGEREVNQLTPGAGSAPGGPTAGNPGEIPEPPGGPTVIDTTDPTLIGTRARSRSLVLSSNINTSLNPFDSFALAASVSRSYYGSRFGADSRSYSTTASYNRNLDAGSTVGARLSVTRSNYLADGLPDSTIMQPQITYTRQLSQLFHINAAIGGLFIQSSGGGQDTKSFSGNIELCRTGERDNLCLSGSRDASASGAGGVRTRLAGALHYSYRLAQYDTINVSIDYSHYSAALAERRGSTFIESDATWETRLGQRILGGATASLRGIEDQISSRRDFSLQVFLRVTLGQLL